MPIVNNLQKTVDFGFHANETALRQRASRHRTGIGFAPDRRAATDPTS
jgi:hypothetical protein